MNSGDVVVEVKQVSKKFSRSLQQSVRYGIADITRNTIGLRAHSDMLRPGEFWAVEDLSFEIHRGETLGIIGANGSGKSTTLKMLNGIYNPDRGQIKISGRVGALIELEAGFHPMLTGRQNVYVNAAILGVAKREVGAVIHEIIDFAAIDDFIDSPVKYYSSGMRARLGFSIAMFMDPDILLIDEVLSVGDASFRAKSYERMLNFRKRGKTICFVSHDLMGVEAICDRVVWLDHGRIQLVDKPHRAIPAYLESQERLLLEQRSKQQRLPHETGQMIISSVETFNREGPTSDFRYRDQLIVRLHYRAFERVFEPFFMVYVISETTNEHIFNANMLRDGGQVQWLEGEGWLDIDFGSCNLYAGVYRIEGLVRKNSNVEYYQRRALGSFVVVSKPEEYGCEGRFSATYARDGGGSIVLPIEYRWSFNGAVQRSESIREK